jgi:hypothetical protein
MSSSIDGHIVDPERAALIGMRAHLHRADVPILRAGNA